LKWIERGIEDSLSSMDGISDNSDLRNISLGCGLVDATSNSKHLGFCTSDECSVMESLDERLVGNVCVCDGCSNVVFDFSIQCDNGYELQGRGFNNYRVKLINMKFITFPLHT